MVGGVVDSGHKHGSKGERGMRGTSGGGGGELAGTASELLKARGEGTFAAYHIEERSREGSRERSAALLKEAGQSRMPRRGSVPVVVTSGEMD